MDCLQVKPWPTMPALVVVIVADGQNFKKRDCTVNLHVYQPSEIQTAFRFPDRVLGWPETPYSLKITLKTWSSSLHAPLLDYRHISTIRGKKKKISNFKAHNSMLLEYKMIRMYNQIQLQCENHVLRTGNTHNKSLHPINLFSWDKLLYYPG